MSELQVCVKYLCTFVCYGSLLKDMIVGRQLQNCQSTLSLFNLWFYLLHNHFIEFTVRKHIILKCLLWSFSRSRGRGLVVFFNVFSKLWHGCKFCVSSAEANKVYMLYLFLYSCPYKLDRKDPYSEGLNFVSLVSEWHETISHEGICKHVIFQVFFFYNWMCEIIWNFKMLYNMQYR